MVIGFLCFMSVAAVPAFIEERAIFMRERMNGTITVRRTRLTRAKTS
jgi:hypothetical protein